jgi:hypothetical protein
VDRLAIRVQFLGACRAFGKGSKEDSGIQMCQEVKAKRMKVVTLFPSKAKKGDLGFLIRMPEILEVLWYF